MFKPYKGGAGPDPEQSKANDMALLEAIKAIGFDCEYIPHPLNEYLYPLNGCVFEKNTDKHLMVVKVGERFGSYDRWGFVCGTVEGDYCDQVSIGEAIDYLIEPLL